LESRPGRDAFLQNIHTCSGAHTASIQRVLRLFPGGKIGWGMMLTSHLPSTKIPLLPLCLHGIAMDDFNFVGFVVAF